MDDPVPKIFRLSCAPPASSIPACSGTGRQLGLDAEQDQFPPRRAHTQPVRVYRRRDPAPAPKRARRVVHVDAAKGMLAWPRITLPPAACPTRRCASLTDDAMNVRAARTAARQRYDGILMDPPSYGRGPGGEMWKIEQDIYPLVEAAAKSLNGTKPLFFLINSYTTGLAPVVLSNVLTWRSRYAPACGIRRACACPCSGIICCSPAGRREGVVAVKRTCTARGACRRCCMRITT
jgi:hypothetical protein